MSEQINKKKLLECLSQEAPTTNSSYYHGWRACLNELSDEIYEGRFDDYSVLNERDELQKRVAELKGILDTVSDRLSHNDNMYHFIQKSIKGVTHEQN